MTASLDLKKLYWHSRRGMLELDLILVPFAQNRLEALDDDGRRLYRQLLEQEDQDLYAWLVLKRPAPVALLPIIERVLANHGAL